MWIIFNKILLFISSVFTALKFAAIDYDYEMQQTKTPKERVIRWVFIGLIAFLILFVFFSVVSAFLRSIVSSNL